MSEEQEYDQYVQNNMEELALEFIKEHKLEDSFEMFCFEQWQSEKASHADYLWDCEKDRQAEQSVQQ